MDKLFDIYLRELLEWNRKFNLTSITNPEEIAVKHFEDSLTVLKAKELTNEKIVDIGSGAGFPGLPLKIARPKIKLTLIEATRKKTDFLNHIIKLLKLEDVEVVWGRAEELSAKYAGCFDVAVARAVAKLPVLVKYALPYLKPGGIFIAQKGPVVEEAGPINNGRIEKILKISLSNGDPRSLVVIKKI